MEKLRMLVCMQWWICDVPGKIEDPDVFFHVLYSVVWWFVLWKMKIVDLSLAECRIPQILLVYHSWKHFFTQVKIAIWVCPVLRQLCFYGIADMKHEYIMVVECYWTNENPPLAVIHSKIRIQHLQVKVDINNLLKLLDTPCPPSPFLALACWVLAVATAFLRSPQIPLVPIHGKNKQTRNSHCILYWFSWWFGCHQFSIFPDKILGFIHHPLIDEVIFFQRGGPGPPTSLDYSQIYFNQQHWA